ncbi:MAG: LamB/YcsF family protein [Proteobacteria bacterium]|jgi:5-oxoprolinase (ATP-hydrolysing) subunit A|nr:LamB/YcsF family protein [Pseudomonadota bacterium]
MRLNCDLGEDVDGQGVGLDAQFMPFIDQANIACGFHAGDPWTASKILDLAAQHGVAVGAHPSYLDRENFGRRSMKLDAAELVAILHYQIGALESLARSKGLELAYVKPHGALYNDMMCCTGIRHVVMQATASYRPSLALMVLATSEYDKHLKEAAIFGIELMAEAYVDRRYDDLGHLLPRDQAGAVLDEHKMMEQIDQLLNSSSVISVSGHELPLTIDSLCVHGDNPAALATIERIRERVPRLSN